jgi:hypothetical protein
MTKRIARTRRGRHQRIAMLFPRLLVFFNLLHNLSLFFYFIRVHHSLIQIV